MNTITIPLEEYKKMTYYTYSYNQGLIVEATFEEVADALGTDEDNMLEHLDRCMTDMSSIGWITSQKFWFCEAQATREVAEDAETSIKVAQARVDRLNQQREELLTPKSK